MCCVVECESMRQSCYKITFSRVAAPHDEIFIEIRDGMRRGAEICDVDGDSEMEIAFQLVLTRRWKLEFPSTLLLFGYTSIFPKIQCLWSSRGFLKLLIFITKKVN